MSMISFESQRSMLAIVCLILLGSNFYLAVALTRVERTIVMVPTIDREMTVGVRSVSEEYLLYRAEQIIQLLFNIRYENFGYNVDQILKQVSSHNKPEFTKQLDEFTSDIKSKKYFYTFNKESFVIDAKKLEVCFAGYLEVFVNNKRVETNYKQYKLSFANKSGLVKLVSFEEVTDAKS